MSKSVLISIQPEWCRLIASGRKTIEVRKSRPKLETPFKVYIYCTRGKQHLLQIMRDGDDCYGETYHGKPVFIKSAEESFFCGSNYVNKTVMGEFICDKIYKYSTSEALKEHIEISDQEAVAWSCLSKDRISDYEYSATGKENCLNNIGVFLWHISDLVIYDKPKELSDFGKTRPPQSWCYIE